MDLNELVRTITREVIKQMGREKECVMILGNRECESIGPVLAHLGDDVEVLFIGDDPGSRTLSRYILPSLCCGSMADLAVGRASGAVISEVLRLLLSGNQVEVFEFQYRSYFDTAPATLYSLYKSYEETLKTYGLKEFDGKQPETVRVDKGLVTEKDVIRAHESGASVLRVPVNANITHLAADSARDLGVKLIKS